MGLKNDLQIKIFENQSLKHFVIQTRSKQQSKVNQREGNALEINNRNVKR